MESNDIQALLEENNIKLIGFDKLRDLQRKYWTDDFVETMTDEFK